MYAIRSYYVLKEIKQHKIRAAPTKLSIAQLRTQLERKSDYDDIPIKPQRVFKSYNFV